MSISRKVDNSYRISIPLEYLEKLNWSVEDKVEVSVENNKVILVRQENASEVNLMPQEDGSRLGKMLSIVKDTSIPALEESVPIKINRNPVADRCHQCLGKLGDSRFKLNGRYICRKCRDVLRDELIFDITHRHRD